MSDNTVTSEKWNQEIDAFIREMNDMVGKPAVRSIDIMCSHPQLHELVTEEVIKDFAWNTGNNNPLFCDSEYAVKTRWGGMIAPPGRFLNYIAETGYLPIIRAIEGVSHLYGGTSYEYSDVIRAGDSYTIDDEFLGVTEKQLENKPYRLLIEKSKRHYTNQNGKTVVTATGNTVITCTYPDSIHKGSKDHAVFGAVKRDRYSQETLDKIHRHYEDYFAGKLTRGCIPRYWEDVQENEPLTPLIKGPIDIADIVGYCCASGQRYGASATKWRTMKKATLRDPDTGEFVYAASSGHFSNTLAREGGLPGALVYAAQHEIFTSEIVTNWIGDDGIVKNMSHQQRKPSFQGDLAFVNGFVKKKYILDGEHLVDIEMWTENQEGVIVCPSKATVLLLSKD